MRIINGQNNRHDTECPESCDLHGFTQEDDFGNQIQFSQLEDPTLLSPRRQDHEMKAGRLPHEKQAQSFASLSAKNQQSG